MSTNKAVVNIERVKSEIFIRSIKINFFGIKDQIGVAQYMQKGVLSGRFR